MPTERRVRKYSRNAVLTLMVMVPSGASKPRPGKRFGQIMIGVGKPMVTWIADVSIGAAV
jgi:hypothetical protein